MVLIILELGSHRAQPLCIAPKSALIREGKSEMAVEHKFGQTARSLSDNGIEIEPPV